MFTLLTTTFILIALRNGQILYANALSVKLLQNVSTLLGDNGTDIECSYTRENVLKIDSVIFMAFNRSIELFTPIATFIPDTVSLITPQGQYLKGRVTLRNITQLSTKAVLIYVRIMCIDHTIYRCNVRYIDLGGEGQDATSNNIYVSVQVPPSKPDRLSLPMTSITTPDLTEGDIVTFECIGDVGNPPQELVIQKYQNNHVLPIALIATNTSVHELSDNCSYYRTSYFTFKVTDEDNRAVIRCFVVQTLTENDMYIDFYPLQVNYAVRIPTITKSANKAVYLVGLDNRINLTCSSESFPEPTFLWYKENQTEPIGTSEIFTINNVVTTNSGIYTCFVSNTFNDVIHTKRVQVYINIINKAKEGQTITPKNNAKTENTTFVVVGVVCGSIILVVCMVSFSTIKYKEKKEKCTKTKNSNKCSADYINTEEQHNSSSYETVEHVLEVHNYEQLSKGIHQSTTGK